MFFFIKHKQNKVKIRFFFQKFENGLVPKVLGKNKLLLKTAGIRNILIFAKPLIFRAASYIFNKTLRLEDFYEVPEIVFS